MDVEDDRRSKGKGDAMAGRQRLQMVRFNTESNTEYQTD